jgi:hypothetical protein
MMLNNVRLPEIVGDLLERTGTLHKLVVNATHEILVEVKTILHEQQSTNNPKMVGEGPMLIISSFPLVRW